MGSLTFCPSSNKLPEIALLPDCYELGTHARAAPGTAPAAAEINSSHKASSMNTTRGASYGIEDYETHVTAQTLNG